MLSESGLLNIEERILLNCPSFFSPTGEPSTTPANSGVGVSLVRLNCELGAKFFTGAEDNNNSGIMLVSLTNNTQKILITEP